MTTVRPCRRRGITWRSAVYSLYLPEDLGIVNRLMPSMPTSMELSSTINMAGEDQKA